MSDNDRLAQLRSRLNEFREVRTKERPFPQPDPNSPHNPFHLPEADMRPRKAPTRADAIHSGAGHLQGKHTATLPNPLVHNWPWRFMGDLYQFCWDNSTGQGDLGALLEKLSDDEVDILLESLDTFNLDDLAAVGGAVYEGLVEEKQRRQGPMLPIKRVRVVATKAFPDDAEEVGKREELQLDTVPKRLRLT